MGALVNAELSTHGVDVRTNTTVKRDRPGSQGFGRSLPDRRRRVDRFRVTAFADLVLVVVGVRPDTALAAEAGAALGVGGAISVDRGMRTNLEGVFAAGDSAVTHHRLMGLTYLPLGTTAHKQGRVAGANAVGASAEFAGSLGTQVVKVFDMVASRTGLRDQEATAAGFDPVTVEFEADDHKAYYPGSHRIRMRYTGDRRTGRLLGLQLFGHKHAEVASASTSRPQPSSTRRPLTP